MGIAHGKRTTPRLAGPDYSVPGQSVVYFLRTVGQPFVKIGKADDWRTRCMELQCGCPFPMEVMLLAPGGFKEEAEAQYLCARTEEGQSYVRGEWFHLDAHVTECIKAIKAVRGDIALVANLWKQMQHERMMRRVILGRSLLAITNLAQEFGDYNLPQGEDVAPRETPEKRAINAERLRRWRAKKRAEKQAANDRSQSRDDHISELVGDD